MSDAKKTHSIQHGNAPAEEVTAAELANIQKVLGDTAFSAFTVTDLQPAKPAELPQKAEPKAKDKAE